MPTHTRVRRKLDPAMAWAPTQDSHYELVRLLHGTTGASRLYLTQSAILQFEAHIRGSLSPLPFGLLAGQVCVCPQTKIEYLLVDTVARARIELTEDNPYAQLAEELRSLISAQAKHKKLAIGWYLGGLADDLTLDGEATDVHRALFPERWQVALVHGETEGTECGALLRFESIWNRWYSIPFFEVAEPAGRRKGERRTALRWANYRTDEPAQPLDALARRAHTANASPSWWESRGFSAFLEPLRRIERGTRTRSPHLVPERAPETTASMTRAAAPQPSSTAESAAPSALATPPAAAAPRTGPGPRGVAVAAEAPPVQPRVESAERARDVTAKVVEAREAAPVSNAAEGALSEVQHVFIDGCLVPVSVSETLTGQPGRFETAFGLRISSLFIGSLLLGMLGVLYLIAR